MVDTAIPAASTGTTAPKKALQRMGVMKMAPIVVAVVMRTDKATFPLAIYVHKLEACPPFTLPTKTIPAKIEGLIPNACPKIRAKPGIIP